MVTTEQISSYILTPEELERIATPTDFWERLRASLDSPECKEKFRRIQEEADEDWARLRYETVGHENLDRVYPSRR